MKLKIDNLPNLFDQYEVEENRLTNALLQTLAISPRIAKRFLNSFIPEISTGKVALIELSEQKMPLKRGGDALEIQKVNESVPDGWLVLHRKDKSITCVVVIESKIKKGSSRKLQLLRHLAKAERKFQPDKNICVLLITPDDGDPFPGWKQEDGSYRWTEWRRIYRFIEKLKKEANPYSAEQLLLDNFREYIEMKELAGFQGIDFSEGYNKEKARRILSTLMKDIKSEFKKRIQCLAVRREAFLIRGMFLLLRM